MFGAFAGGKGRMKRQRKRIRQNGSIDGPVNGSFYLRYWSAEDVTGRRVRKTAEIGTKGQFASKQAAGLSVEAALLRDQVNAGVAGATLGEVIVLYERAAMPQRVNTKKTAQAYLFHCREKWADEPIAVLALPSQSQRLQGWLDGLQSRPTKNCKSKPLAANTKKGIKIQMGLLFKFAMQRGFIPSVIDPMHFIKLKKGVKPGRRQTLTIDELWAFLDDPSIPEHVKVMAHVARLTGLRISEILGLQESDFDLDKMQLAVQRRIFLRDVDGPKTTRSGDPIPVSEELYGILSSWLKSPRFNSTEDGWLFASWVTGFPWYASELRRSYLTPWGVAHGIKQFGWHTFRHSFKQFLENAAVHPVVIQRLMRHSSYQVTDGYGSGVDMDRLRDGQQKAAETKGQPQLVVKKKRWA